MSTIYTMYVSNVYIVHVSTIYTIHVSTMYNVHVSTIYTIHISTTYTIYKYLSFPQMCLSMGCGRNGAHGRMRVMPHVGHRTEAVHETVQSRSTTGMTAQVSI